MNTHHTRLTFSANEIEIWYDDESSHAATHIQDTPELRDLAALVLSQTELSGGYVQFHRDLGEPVGMTDLIETEPDDVVVYAKRLNRNEYTVFNKSKPPQPSSFVSVAVERQPDLTYELVSAWIGRTDSPPFPGTPDETPESKHYWMTHALAWGRQAIQPGTETTTCPW